MIRLVRSAQRIARSQRLHRSLPWSGSLALHLVVIVAAAFIAWRVIPDQSETPPISVSFEQPAIAPAMLTTTPTEMTDQADETLERLLAVPADMAEVEAPAVPAIPEPPDIVEPAHTAFLPETLALGEPLEVEFSGLGASDARDIVYVVDASGSMITSMPDVLAELRRSINQLHPSQRFQALLFRTPPPGSADPAAYQWLSIPAGLHKPVLIDATKKNKRAISDWLDTIAPRMRSNPLPALEAAIDLKPDAIFVLSSGASDPALLGGTPDEILARLDRLNPVQRNGVRRVVIQTVQVLEDDPLKLLRSIARAHGGESGYKFISRDDLARRQKENIDSP
jgi:hypothetical protein